MARRGFSADQIEPAWDRVMEASDKDFARLMRQAGPFQEQLSAFVFAFSLRMRAEVSRMTREMMLCIYQVYREHARAVRPATEDAVVAAWTRAQARMDELQVLIDAGEGWEGLVAHHPQPALLATVLGVLMDVDPDEEDGVPLLPDAESPELTDDEFWRLLTVMYTILDVLETHAEHATAV